jgi:beta-glucosidase
VTVAQSAGHIPCTYDFGPYGRGYYHKPGAPGAPGRDYVFDSPDPLWAFGYGLSYTRFSYSGLEIRTPRVAAAGGSLELAFKVANDGDRTGKVVAQVYWRDLVAQVAPPEKRLLRFEKIELRPGETREVSLTVPVGEFRSLTVDGRWIIDPGEIEIQVGDNAEAISLKGVFAIHG